VSRSPRQTRRARAPSSPFFFSFFDVRFFTAFVSLTTKPISVALSNTDVNCIAAVHQKHTRKP
jgi:hypothetical protein